MAATTRPMTHRQRWYVLAIGLSLVAGWALEPLRQWRSSHLQPASVFHSQSVRVGIEPSREPFAYFDAAGNYIGYEVELAEAIATYVGLPLQLTGLGVDGLEDALITNQVDIIIAALPPAPGDTRGALRLTRHYFNDGLVLVSPWDVPLHTWEQMPGTRLALAYGSEAESAARRWQRRLKAFTMAPYETSTYALDAVRLGHANSALVTYSEAAAYRRQHFTWQQHTALVADRWYTLAVRSDRADMQAVLNAVLNALDDAGTLEALQEKWF